MLRPSSLTIGAVVTRRQSGQNAPAPRPAEPAQPPFERRPAPPAPPDGDDSERPRVVSTTDHKNRDLRMGPVLAVATARFARGRPGTLQKPRHALRLL